MNVSGLPAPCTSIQSVAVSKLISQQLKGEFGHRRSREPSLIGLDRRRRCARPCPAALDDIEWLWIWDQRSMETKYGSILCGRRLRGSS